MPMPARKMTSRKRAEQPLGMGVADSFAVRRLAGGRGRSRRNVTQGVRELGWDAFGQVARELAEEIARRYAPEIVLGVAKGGVFAGAAIASALKADFHPVRVERRSRDHAPVKKAKERAKRGKAAAKLPDVKGKRVLVVDDVVKTGETINRARELAKKAGAREVQVAALVVRPGGVKPEWYALETDDLVLFGWDYEIESGGGPIDPGEVGV